jgi:chitinase
MKKTIITAIGALMLFLAFSNSSIAAQNIWVTAYYAGWSQGYNNTGTLPAQSIDFTAMTNIDHFSVIPSLTGTLDDSTNGVTAYNANALIVPAHAAGVKVLITVGGAGTDVSFRGATSAAYLPTFTANLINLMKSRGYDGIDVDWETLEATDSTQYEALITSLRTAMNGITPRPLLTTAVAWQPAVLAKLSGQLDQINIMTYDMSGAWSGWITWHNSPIYDGGFRFPSTGGLVPSIDGDVNTWSTAGVPIAKLGVGIDFYGYVWTGGTGTPTSGVTAPRQSWTTAPTVSANLPYSTIMQSYYKAANYRWDTAAQASYLSVNTGTAATDEFISYDDTASAARKVDYARAKGVGGIIIWELSGGYRPTMPAGQQDLLLQSVKHEVGATISTIVPAEPVDITPPTNETGANVNSVPFSWTETVAGATFHFQLSVNTTFSTTVSDQNNLTAASATVSSLAYATTYYWRVNATNSIGTSAWSSTSTFTTSATATSKDTTHPTISLTTPASGAAVSGTVVISAAASDNVRVTSVQFKLDGANLGNPVTASPYTYSWATITAANGAHTVSAIASDSAGNTATASATVTVSNTVVAGGTSLWIYQENLVSPWMDASYNVADTMASTAQKYAGSYSIKVVQGAWGAFSLHSGSWAASVPLLPASYASVQFAVFGGTSGITLNVELENDQLSSFPTVSVGAVAANVWKLVTIPLSQIDPAGNSFERIDIMEISGVPKTYYVDNIELVGSAPVAPVPVSPAGNAKAAPITSLGFSWTEATAIATFHLQVSTDSTFATTFSDQNGLAADSAKVSGLAYSTLYHWRVNATNSNGTSSWSTLSAFTTTVRPTPKDTTPPTVAFVTPIANAVVSGTVTVTANATDNVRVTSVLFKLDGVNVGTALTTAPYTYSWNSSASTNGAHTLSTVAYDSAGNTAASTRTVTVSNTSIPIVSNLLIYQDSLASSWMNTSYNATVTFNSTAYRYAGAYAVKVVQGAWGAFSVHNGTWASPVAMNPSAFTSLQFAVSGGASGITLNVALQNDSGKSFPTITVGAVAANVWKVVTVPITQLDPSGYVFQRVDIMEESGVTKTYYLDNIELVGVTAGSSKTPTLAGTPSVSSPMAISGLATMKPKEFELAQNYPNPFNPTTTINYSLPSDANVTLDVYNMLGQKVVTLFSGIQTTGEHQANFNGANLASGVYIYRMEAHPVSGGAAFTQVKKMVLTK